MSEHNPSPEELSKLTSHYRDTVWSTARAQRATVDSLIDVKSKGAFDLWQGISEIAKDARTKFRPPFAANIIRHLMNQQSAYRPRVHREPHSEHEDARTDADHVENGAAAALVLVAKRHRLPVFKQLYRYLFQYDYTVCKLDVRRFNKPEPEEKDFDEESSWKKALDRWGNERDNWDPFRIEVPHPDQVLMDPSEKRPPFAVHVYKVPAGRLHELSMEAMAKFQDGKMLKGSLFHVPTDPYEDVEVVEYTSEEWHKVSAEGGGTLLWEERNIRGVTGWYQAFGGQGFEAAGDSGAKPEHLANPFLLDLYDAIVMRTQGANMRHQSYALMAFANLRISQNLNAEQVVESLAAGAVVEDAGPDDIGYIPTPQLPGWLMQEDQTIARVIEEGSVPTIASGINAPNVESVGQTVILSERADNVSNDVRSQTESIVSLLTSDMLKLTDVLADADLVPRGGLRYAKHRIDPRQLHGDYNAEVEFELVDPVLLLQERQQALAELDRGVMSLERFFRVSRLEDVTGEVKNIIFDRLMKSDALTAEAMRLVAKERLNLDLADIMGAMAEGKPVLSGGNGGTPGALAGVQGATGEIGAAEAATRQLREPLGNMNGVAGAGGAPKPPARQGGL